MVSALRIQDRGFKMIFAELKNDADGKLDYSVLFTEQDRNFASAASD